jgi:2-polyprenyl-3-methyl-5-hydroxy-6-metoxy-1,4-benzoquinol methylase|tara:strand:- start:467 stop:1318 length:852 start_codon:yes stop_codon:yes gene_type:complete
MACGEEKINKYGLNSNKLPVLYCKSCSLTFIQQEPISNNQLRNRYQEGDFWDDANYDLQKMHDSNFTDEQGKHFALNWSSMFEYSKKYILKNQKILEIGVGTGVHMIMFDKHGYDITGIEPDKRNTLLINKKLIDGNCINGFVEDQNFQNKFDVIWLYHVVEHISNPKNLIEYCDKFLKNKGLIIIAVPDCDNPDSLKDSINNPDHLWHFSKNSLKKLFSKMNYKIEELDSMSSIKDLNKQRIHSRLEKNKFSFINKKIWPYWPLKITTNNDGYEIRIILKKT